MIKLDVKQLECSISSSTADLHSNVIDSSHSFRNLDRLQFLKLDIENSGYTHLQ